MKGMTSTAVLHGYVDGRLSHVEREALEISLQGDNELSAQVELWRSHRENLREIFGVSDRAPAPSVLHALRGRSERPSFAPIEAFASTRARYKAGAFHASKPSWAAYFARRIASISSLTIIFLMLGSGPT